MSFVNPNFRNQERKLNNEEKVETIKTEEKEIAIPLDEILNSTKVEKPEIEFIDYPHNAKIVNVPRNENLSAMQMGIITIKYENQISNNTKKAL